MDNENVFPLSYIKEDRSAIFWYFLKQAQKAKDADSHKLWFDLAMRQVKDYDEPYFIPDKQKHKIDPDTLKVFMDDAYPFLKKSIGNSISEDSFRKTLKQTLVQLEYIPNGFFEEFMNLITPLLPPRSSHLKTNSNIKFNKNIDSLKIDAIEKSYFETTLDSIIIKDEKELILSNQSLNVKKDVLPDIYSNVDKHFPDISIYARQLLTGLIAVQLNILQTKIEYDNEDQFTNYRQYLVNNVSACLKAMNNE